MLCLSEVYKISQHYKNWYDHTLHGRRDIAGSYTVQIFATSFLKLCAAVRPVFSSILATQLLHAEGLTRAFLNHRSGCQTTLKNVSVLPPNLSLACLKQSISETVTDIAKSSRQSLEKVIGNYFVAQIGTKSCLRRSNSCEKNSIP